jgi:hypothetical protein
MGFSDKDCSKISIPTGIPIVYKFDEDMKPFIPDDGSLMQVHTTGVFLEKPGHLQEALAKNAQWNEHFKIDGSINKQVHSLDNLLLKLRHVKEDLGDEIQKL